MLFSSANFITSITALVILSFKQGGEELETEGSGADHSEGNFLGIFCQKNKKLKVINTTELYEACEENDDAVFKKVSEFVIKVLQE